MIKRSMTFEQGAISKFLTTTTTTTSSSCSPLSYASTFNCCINKYTKQISTFSCLLRNNPPILPGDILNYFNFTKSSSMSTFNMSRSNVNVNLTGKVKVIICINQECDNTNNHTSQGLGMIATTTLKTVGSLLPTNGSSNSIQLKTDKNTPPPSSSSSNCIEIDRTKRIITLLDPTPSRRRRGVGGIVRNYRFDNIVTQDTLKPEFRIMVLNDALTAVLNGKDSCILTIGHKATAVEITGLNEEFHDLLANTTASFDEEYSDKSPSHYLQSTNKSIQQKHSTSSKSFEKTAQSISVKMMEKLSHLCELRASTAEKAAYLLDTALSNRTVHTCNNYSGLSHMLFTLHLYQCKLENNSSEMSISGGRTKLHFLDLGCGRYGQHSINANNNKFNKSNECRTISKALSLSGIGCVLLALLTGRRQLPFHESALTYLLREAITGNQIQPCILAHVSSNVQYYTETLQVIQLATEINRLRRRKIAINHIGTLTKDHQLLSLNTNKSQEENRRPRLGRLSYARSLGSCSSEFDCTSSGEQSCDTVIYVGNDRLQPGERRLSDSRIITSHSLLKKLGPRGLADGSVDIMDKTQSSRGSSSESIAMNDTTLKQHSNDQNRHTNESTTIKRMIPRTNATVWPRIVNRTRCRKLLQTSTTSSSTISSSITTSETMRTTEETWIDGPNVTLTNCSNSLSQLIENNKTISTPSSLLPPPAPAPPSYHNCVHNLIKDQHMKTSFISNTEEVINSLETQNILNVSMDKSIQHLMSTTATTTTTMTMNSPSITTHTGTTTTENNFSSTFSTLDNNLTRALSDISECTEDAETIHDSNSMKQSIINIPLNDELSTDLLTSRLLSFDNLYTTYQIPINCKLNEPQVLNNTSATYTTTAAATKPTEVLLDIGRQIREASKCNNYNIPTSYVTVNVPQYLNHLYEDEESISNVNDTKLLCKNEEMKQSFTIPNEMNLLISSNSNGKHTPSLLSKQFSQNNEVTSKHTLQSINTSNTLMDLVHQQQSNQYDQYNSHIQLKHQHNSTQSQLKSSIVDKALTNNLLRNNNNNNNVTNHPTLPTTTTVLTNHNNNSLFRVAEWVSNNNTTPTPPTTTTMNNIRLCISKEKQYSNNDSANDSLKCRKENNSMINSNSMLKLNETFNNKQVIPLYSSSPLVPPPSLLSTNNDVNVQFYPFNSMNSEHICHMPQSHSTPLFHLSHESTSQNLHNSINRQSVSPVFSRSNHCNTHIDIVNSLNNYEIVENKQINQHPIANLHIKNKKENSHKLKLDDCIIRKNNPLTINNPNDDVIKNPSSGDYSSNELIKLTSLNQLPSSTIHHNYHWYSFNPQSIVPVINSTVVNDAKNGLHQSNQEEYYNQNVCCHYSENHNIQCRNIQQRPCNHNHNHNNNNNHEVMKTQNALKQQYKNNFHLTLSNSPSAGFSAVSGKLSTSVYRSTRRSGGGGGGGGGPSSSGYESMHTGASELSLSHQDSANE
ncbi:Kinesin-like protein KIF26A [Schistosoma japonicum]|nr:Kinesin-like protein KIF26A [Schistosoma japonicum]